MIDEAYGNYCDGKSVTLSSGGTTQTISLASFDAKVNAYSTAQTIIDDTPKGNWFSKVFYITQRQFKAKNYPLVIDYNNDALTKEVDDFAQSVDMSLNAYAVDSENSTLIVNGDALGGGIDTEATVQNIIASIGLAKVENASAVTSNTKTPAEKAAYIRDKLPTDPVDASAVSENGQVVIVPEKDGIDFDQTALETAIAKGGTVTVPITIKAPNITESKLEEVLFRDTLSEYTTSYAMDGSRSNNIAVAAGKINGNILLPGDTFSFNSTVGERTFASGFAIAHVYSAGQIIDGVGGGICQVSTTLYNAVLYADLDVVERHNHSFTVGYVPLGQDATVSYNGPDFKFKNSTNYPIKIVASTSGTGKINIKLLGTNEDPTKQIEIVNVKTATNPFNVVEKPNPDPNSTKAVTQQNGMTGYTVESTKIIKRDGKEVNRVSLGKSVYSSLDKIVLVPQKTEAPVDNAPAVGPMTQVPIVENPPADNSGEQPINPGGTFEN